MGKKVSWGAASLTMVLLALLLLIAGLTHAQGPKLVRTFTAADLSTDPKKLTAALQPLAVSPDKKFLVCGYRLGLRSKIDMNLTWGPICVIDLAHKALIAQWSPKLAEANGPDDPAVQIAHLEFSDDGNWAFVAWSAELSDRITYEVLDTRSWDSVASVPVDMGPHFQLHWVLGRRHLSHDGRQFAFCSCTGDRDMWRVHVRRTAAPKEDVLCVGSTNPTFSPDGKFIAVKTPRGRTNVFGVEGGDVKGVFEHLLNEADPWSRSSRYMALLDEASRKSVIVIDLLSSNQQIANVPGMMGGFVGEAAHDVLITTSGTNIQLWSPLGNPIAHIPINTRKSMWNSGGQIAASFQTTDSGSVFFLESAGDDFKYNILRSADSRTGKVEASSIRLPERFSAIVISSDGAFIAVDDSAQKKIDVWHWPLGDSR